MAETRRKTNRVKLMAGLVAGGSMAIAGFFGSAVANAEPPPPVLNGEPLIIPWPGGAWAEHDWSTGWPGGAWAGHDWSEGGWPGGGYANGKAGGAWNHTAE